MVVNFLSQESLYSGNYFYIERNNQNEVDYGVHYHDFYEVQFYKSIFGKLIIHDKEYEVFSGDIALINAFEPHRLILEQTPSQERFCLNFGPSFLLSLSSEHSNILGIFSSANPKYPLMHFTEEEFAKYTSMLSRFSNMKLLNGRDILEKAYLYELLAHIYNHFYDKAETTHKEPHVSLMIKLIQYIEEHLSEDLSLQRLAAEVNFSRYHLCRVFKNYTGYTLNQYIVSKRIEKARSLINGTDSISEISKNVGFNNYSYFYKTFKKTYGVSPAEWKK